MLPGLELEDMLLKKINNCRPFLYFQIHVEVNGKYKLLCTWLLQEQLTLHLIISRALPRIWVQFWTLHCKGGISRLEMVQRRATRLLSGVEGFSYNERMERLNMFGKETSPINM